MSAEQSLEQQFAKAASFYEKGKFDKAKKIFRGIQRGNPGIPEVLHMLALIALKTNRAEDAVGHLESAVQSAPGSADLFGLLGGALEKAGRTEDAAKAFEQAITLEPGLAETHYNLGNALRDLGRSQDAVVSYRRAVELYPGFADALNNLGRVLADMGSNDDAVRSFLGACAITPGDAWIYSNLGNTYRNMGKAEDAIDTHRRAVELDPESVVYRSNLAAALVEIGLTEDGADEFRRALEAAPGDPGLLCGFGNALVDQGRIEDAKAAFAQALEAEPDNPMAHYLLGRALLLDGDFGRGWQEFAWRFKVASLGLRDPDLLPQPPWQGEKVGGKTILVWGEQGVGDEVLFAGQIPELLAQGANVVMECDPRLIPLFERSLDGVRGIPRTDPRAEESRSPDSIFRSHPATSAVGSSPTWTPSLPTAVTCVRTKGVGRRSGNATWTAMMCCWSGSPGAAITSSSGGINRCRCRRCSRSRKFRGFASSIFSTAIPGLSARPSRPPPERR